MNTTDIMLVHFSESGVVEKIGKEIDIPLMKITDGEKAGGPKILTIQAHGACVRCIGPDKMKKLIKLFHEAPFDFPNSAALIISDDNGDFEGVVLRNDI